MARHEFLLPDVGEGLDKGLILRWLVATGDTVETDQLIVEVETDKAIVEIPAPVSGTVLELGGDAGDTLEIGAVLAVFETEGGAPSAAAPQAQAPEVASTPAAAPAMAASSTSNQSQGRVRASPATRKLARSLGVDLSALSGTGSKGQITRADVENAKTGTATDRPQSSPARAARPRRASQIQAPSEASTVEPLSGLRRQIALNMEEAWRTVPHIFTFEQTDATELVQARRALNEEFEPQGFRVSYLPFFVKACVAALQEHPRFNASIDTDNEQITYHHRYNVGIATATPEGLIVTVVHDADQKSLGEVAQEIEELAGLARERRVKVEQIRGGTFTISNYGSYGGWMGTPIIRPPEVAIAGFGRIHDAVVPVDGQPGIRTILPMAVSTDHRLNDGEHLGAFMDTIIQYLSAPVRLLGR
ncbi:MAG: 2-oxo acid dehydrogenase subunit E2 [Gammaproteobacteria bacterium]|nr:2-oxo acid dehydrogenase subunit E2 [Gammaproteobacteria bacterium]